MSITSSQLIEKISKLKDKPVRLSGYLLFDENKKETKIKLYPKLDPRCYYVIEKDCILDTLPTKDDEHQHMTLLLDPCCEVECVERKYLRSCDLVKKQPIMSCNCEVLDDPKVLFSKKDLRAFVLRMARLLAAMGLDGDFKCKAGRDSVSVPCCEAWKDLVAALDTDQETAAAQWVEASCFATG